MTSEEELRWEKRFSRPAGAAALAAGVLFLIGTVLLISLRKNRPGIEPGPEFLLSVHDSPGKLIAATALQAVGALLLTIVFYYMFRATVHRAPVIPRWFVYLVFAGPAMYAIAQLLNAFQQIDVAHTFADMSSHLKHCPAIRGTRGSDCATDLLRHDVSRISIGLGLAGSVATAFLFVMLPLRARRAGLLSPFMGVMGIVAGVLFVIPLFPGVPVVIQAFWLGALGVLYLGAWPGGRGPAWETGNPDPWPSTAQRRGLVSGGGDRDGEPSAPPEPEPEPVPARPRSRKRKRKR